jgi:hypothetical protein
MMVMRVRLMDEKEEEEEGGGARGSRKGLLI